jgi:predicted HNH restriction endonuclease
VLSAAQPDRFIDFVHERWRAFANVLDTAAPQSGTKDYGKRIIWAGAFARQIADTPTYQQFWGKDDALWRIAGISWDAVRHVGLRELAIRRCKEEEIEYDEGRERYRWHKVRERSGAVVAEAKRIRLETDPLLRCDACGFSFIERYGELGAEFIEAHHTTPLGELELGTRTKTTDLALVCANCHRMLHSPERVLSIDELKAIVDKRRDLDC